MHFVKITYKYILTNQVREIGIYNCRLKVKFNTVVIYSEVFIRSYKSLSKSSNMAANDVRQRVTDPTRYLNHTGVYLEILGVLFSFNTLGRQ